MIVDASDRTVERPSSRGPLLAAAILVLTCAGSAEAQQPAASGIVEDPCPPKRPVPDEILAYMGPALDPARTPVAKPLESFRVYNANLEEAKRTDWAQLCRYRRDNAALAPPRAGERRVVYIGDSITDLWGMADPGFFTRGRINRGISGQTTGQMLVRFQADVVALKPSVVHILAGGNDIAGNNGPEAMEDVHHNIAAMATLARAAGIRVVLASVTPAVSFPWRPGLKPAPQIDALNRWLRSYSRLTGARFVDYHRLLAEPSGGMPPSLTFDGVHLNLPAYRRIEPASVAATERR